MMRPDGAGTDERVSPEERRRFFSSSDSLERGIFKLALLFALISTIGWGAFFLSKRAAMPDLSSDNPAMRQE